MANRFGDSKYLWEVLPPNEQADELAKALGIPVAVAQSLCHRDVTDEESARRFLEMKWSDLVDPAEMHGTVAAGKRIAQAVAANEKIVIYGDYDVDGTTSTAILHECITLAGGNVDFYVPSRMEEGYGVNADALNEILDDGAKLVVTVDCGISAADVVAEFKGRLDFIITDHHTLSDKLPQADAVVHPALSIDGKAYPNPVLCGAGVAFKVAWQAARAIEGTDRVSKKMQNFLINATALAALGTIADVVPLLGENRTIASLGMIALKQVEHVGMQAMVKAFCRGDNVTIRDVGFGIAPRINAAGRMGHASTAIKLMMTDSPEQAAAIAKELDKLNEQRKVVEREITEQAVELVKSGGLDSPDHKIIVLHDDAWHSGVIGIVAARLMDRFSKPVVMIAVDENGQGQGSARSIDGFHIANAFTACSQWLISNGGHAKAAGLKIDMNNIDSFVETLSKYAVDNFSDDMLLPKLPIDAEAKLYELATMSAARTVNAMEPFGSCNAQPYFLMRNCKVVGRPKRMGRNGATLGLTLTQNDSQPVRGVGFFMGDCADFLETQRDVDVVVTPTLNTFNGSTNIEFLLKDIRVIQE